MTTREQRLSDEITRLNKQIEEMASPTVLMYRTLTQNWPDTPEINHLKAIWILGSFLEDWNRTMALSNIR